MTPYEVDTPLREILDPPLIHMVIKAALSREMLFTNYQYVDQLFLPSVEMEPHPINSATLFWATNVSHFNKAILSANVKKAMK